MDLATRKIQLAQQIFNIKQASLLDKLEALIQNEPIDLTEEQKKGIDDGIESLDKSSGISHDQVSSETKKNFPNLF